SVTPRRVVPPRLLTHVSEPLPSAEAIDSGLITHTFLPARASVCASMSIVPRSVPSHVVVPRELPATVRNDDCHAPLAVYESPTSFLNSSGPMVIRTDSSDVLPKSDRWLVAVPVRVSVSAPPVWKSSTSVPMPRFEVDLSVTVAFLSCSSGALYVSEPDPPSTRFGSTLFAPLTVAVG